VVCFCHLLVFVPAAPPPGVHFLLRALLKFAPMEQNQQLMQLKGIRKERVIDILAADPALYRLNGRYLRAPGLISRSCSGQPWRLKVRLAASSGRQF
jgi:hypothetical protein